MRSAPTALALVLFSFQAQAQQSPATPLPSARPPYMGWLSIAKGPVPGFAGAVTTFTLGPDRSISNCVLNAMVTDTAVHAAAARQYFARPDADQGMAPRECGRVTNIKVRQAKYGITELVGWLDAIETAGKISAAASPTPPPQRFVAKRIDVRSNQIQIASPNPEVIARFRKIADSLSVPSDAIDFSDEDVRGVLSGLGLLPPPPAPGGTIFFEFQVDKPAQFLNDGKEKLVLMGKNSAGLAGDASVQFVVSPEGKPDPSTFKVLRTTSDQISLFLRQQIASVQFSPAVRGAAPVPQLVQMTFHF